MTSKLSQSQIDKRLASLPEWTQTGDAVQRTYGFPDFVKAIAFVNATAEHAERVQHHADILVRYNKVTLTLSTHDAKGITAKDFDSAAAFDRLYGG
jgi:4a-hydroxytetrahydrobiopterin dehydratase